MSDKDNYKAMWRASAHEAVPYTHDFPECLLVLPELIDGAIDQGKASIINIIIVLDENTGTLIVRDNGRGISDPGRLLNWAAKDSTTIHHRYGHGSKKCLTKWNKDYNTPWYIKYRTIDRRGNSGSLFTYNGPFEGYKISKIEEDEINETILMPSGLEWYIKFNKNVLQDINTPIKLFTAIKEIIRTRYSKIYLDKIEFIIEITQANILLKESSKEKNWTTFEESINNAVTKNECKLLKQVTENFNDIVMTYTKYQIQQRADRNLNKEFPTYGKRSMKCTRIYIALNGRTIEIKPYHKCLNRLPHNDMNGIIGFINFEGTDYTKMPTPCTTKVSFYENCPIFKSFLEKFISLNEEISIPPSELPELPSLPKSPSLPKPPSLPSPPKPSPNKDKISKEKINKKFKSLVWNRYIGENIASHKCFCCKMTTIKNVDFICGHVNPECKGGLMEINNMRPICSGCNGSMGSKDMVNFVKENNFYIG